MMIRRMDFICGLRCVLLGLFSAGGCAMTADSVTREIVVLQQNRASLSQEEYLREQVRLAKRVYQNTNETITDAYLNCPPGETRQELVKIATGYRMSIRPRYMPLVLYVVRFSNDRSERLIALAGIKNLPQGDPVFGRAHARKWSIVSVLGESLEDEPDGEVAKAITACLAYFVTRTCGYDLRAAIGATGSPSEADVSVEQMRTWWNLSGRALARQRRV